MERPEEIGSNGQKNGPPMPKTCAHGGRTGPAVRPPVDTNHAMPRRVTEPHQVSRAANQACTGQTLDANRWAPRGQARSWQTNHAGLNFDHFEVFFARTALRASPVHGDLVPRGAGRNAFIWGASGFVVYPAANQTHPSFSHSLAFKVQGEKVGARPRGARIEWVALYR